MTGQGSVLTDRGNKCTLSQPLQEDRAMQLKSFEINCIIRWTIPIARSGRGVPHTTWIIAVLLMMGKLGGGESKCSTEANSDK